MPLFQLITVYGKNDKIFFKKDFNISNRPASKTTCQNGKTGRIVVCWNTCRPSHLKIIARNKSWSQSYYIGIVSQEADNQFEGRFLMNTVIYWLFKRCKNCHGP